MVIPVGEGVERDLLFEQAAGFGSGDPFARVAASDGAQFAVDGGAANRKQKGFEAGIEGHLSLTFEDVNPDGEEGMKAVRAEAAAQLPKLGEEAGEL